MTALATVIGRGVAASRPAAGSVPVGTLYYSTDTGAFERNNGSSWDSMASAGFTNPMTTQDDLIVGGASGAAARLAKGTDGQVLTVDPTTHHLIWATPSGGSALTVEEVDGSPTDSAITKIVFPNGSLGIASHVATYTPAASSGALVALHDETLATDTATLTYSPPGSGYRDLEARIDGRTDEAANNSVIWCRANADSGGNYDCLTVDHNVTGGLVATNTFAVAQLLAGYLPGTSAPSGTPGSVEALSRNYLGTTFHKEFTFLSGLKFGVSNGNLYRADRHGWWRNTAAITQLDFTIATAAKKFLTGTRFTVWGVKAS